MKNSSFQWTIALTLAITLIYFQIAPLGQTNTGKDTGLQGLVAAVKARDGARVSSLLRSGVDPNGIDAAGETPLTCAAGAGDMTSAVLLLAAGADVNTRDAAGRAPLHAAALSGRKEMAKLLLAKGASANTPDRAGLTPLHDAAIGGNREMAEILLASGADSGATDVAGLTPAGEAARNHHQDLADSLNAKAAPRPSQGTGKSRMYTNEDLGAVRQRSRLANEDQLSRATAPAASAPPDAVPEASLASPKSGKSTLNKETRENLQRAFDAGTWTEDIVASQEFSKEIHRPVLALFTGSDWCHFCKLLESNVLSTDLFREGVKGKYILLYIDFPRRKTVPEEVLAQRTRLGEKYGVRAYPTLLALRDGDLLLDRISGFGQGMTAEKYISRIGEIAP